jgi:hypothetical protein
MSVSEFVHPFLALVAASALGVIAHRLAASLTRRGGSPVRRIGRMLGSPETARGAEVPFGSKEHQLRLAFERFHIPVAGRERAALQTSRIGAGLGLFLLLYFLVGFPLITSLIGFLAGVLLVNALVDGAWMEVRHELEKEIPVFSSGLSSTIQVTSNVLQAVEEEALNLRPGSPLQDWLLRRFVAPCQSRGKEAVGEVIDEAFSLSSSLGIVTFLIARLWQTGGEKYEAAFGMASSNLEGLLDARLLGQAAGQSARESTLTIAGVVVLAIVMIVRSPALAATVQTPLVQIVYAGIILMMIFGWGFMNRIIDEAI